MELSEFQQQGGTTYEVQYNIHPLPPTLVFNKKGGGHSPLMAMWEEGQPLSTVRYWLRNKKKTAYLLFVADFYFLAEFFSIYFMFI